MLPVKTTANTNIKRPTWAPSYSKCCLFQCSNKQQMDWTTENAQ